MVQSYQSPIKVYKYPFELVMEAYVMRFPRCDMIPIMADTEIILDEKSDDESLHRISRRCKLHLEAPYLLKKIMGVEFIYFVQTNTLNKSDRTLSIEAYNESYDTRVVINETCKYWVHPENPEWTCFEQMASLDVKSFFGFESTVEKIAMKQYSQNISKGKEIIEYFINELEKKGITSVPKWEPKTQTKVPEVTVTSAKSDSQDSGNISSLENSEEEEEETRSHTTSTNSADLHLGASASNIPNIKKMSLKEDTMSKLDSDYIKRCLGNLNPLQESRLVQLKKWVAELQKGKVMLLGETGDVFRYSRQVPSDTTLLRFLRARDFNIEKAREMLSTSLIWRKKNQVDKILSEYQVPQVIKDYFPGGWHYNDKDGRPLYLLRLGQMDVKGLVKSVGEDGLLKHTLHICEEGLRLTEEATTKLNRPITTWTLLVDLEGLNMRHLWRPGIRTLLKIIDIVENNYPETMSHVLIVRAPRVFPILWTLVSTFIDEHTRSKFLFYGGNDYQGPGGLVDYMPKEFIPDFLDGDCKSTVEDGGLVPKTMYLPGEDIESARQHIQLNDQSIYHSVSLGRLQVHEVILQISEPGSVICWDFDVMKSDVSFSVIRTKNTISNNKEPQSPTGAMGVIDAVMGTDDLHKSIIDKSWKEGDQYSKVEPSLVCHDGESIQGSHVTAYVGSYILQWRHYEASPHNSPLDIIDNITSPKASVMYYYEILKSADYRGSMSSLQSCQSGFSSLSSTSKSMNSSCPSR